MLLYVTMLLYVIYVTGNLQNTAIYKMPRQIKEYRKKSKFLKFT